MSAQSIDRDQILRTMAGRYVWWMPVDEAAKWPERVIAQVMYIGDWDDAMALVVAAGREAFISTLKNAEAGWMDHRSWNFWHLWLGLARDGEVPPMPVRRIEPPP